MRASYLNIFSQSSQSDYLPIMHSMTTRAITKHLLNANLVGSAIASASRNGIHINGIFEGYAESKKGSSKILIGIYYKSLYSNLQL